MTVPSAPLRPWSRRAEALAAVGFWLILGVLSVVRRAVGPWHPEGIPVGDVIETLDRARRQHQVGTRLRAPPRERGAQRRSDAADHHDLVLQKPF